MKEITHNNQVAGIYCIENTKNGKKYIGSARNMYRRIKQHFSMLLLNQHYNAHLTSAYKLYGKESFIYYAIEELEETLLIEREQYWVDILKVCDPKIGYNKATVIINSSGYKVSEEGRKRMSEGQKGKKYTKETIEANSKKRWKKIYQFNLKNEFIQEWPSIKEAASHLGIERSLISHALSSKGITGGGFLWKFSLNEANKTIKRWRNRPIQCVETKEIYKNQKEAAEILNLRETDISNSIKRGRRINKKYTFIKYEE